MKTILKEKTLPIQVHYNSIKPPRLSKVALDLDNLIFVVGRANNGWRYYSDSINSINNAYHIFKECLDVIEYFGGGEAEIFIIDENGYDIIYSKKI